jgi:hypothetical protein
MRITISTTLVAALIVCATSAQAADLLWNDDAGIHRNANHDPPAPELLFETFDTRGIAIDGANDRLFWSDVLPLGSPFPGGVIRTGSTQGGDIADVVHMLPSPSGVAVDAARGRIYWSDLGDLNTASGVYSANLNGTDARRIIGEMSLAEIAGIAIDSARDKLYFTYVNPLIDSLYAGGIGVADLDGSNWRPILGGLGSPQGLAIDWLGGEVYWADAGLSEGNGAIQAGDLRGEHRRTILGGLSRPFGVALDLVEKNVYWTDTVQGKIQRTAMPGVLPFFEDVIGGLPNPTALAARSAVLAGSTWQKDADGDWATPSNWDPKVPDAAGDRAIFGGAITAPRVVTVDRPVNAGHILFASSHSYTIAASDIATDDANTITLDAKTGDALIQVEQGSHAIDAPLRTVDDTVITVFDAAGKLTIALPFGNDAISLTKAGAGTLQTAGVRARSLAVNGGRLVLRGSESAPEVTSIVGELAIAGNVSSPIATLDVAASALVVDYSAGETNPTANVRQLILAGRGGSGLDKPWDGTGISSSQVQSDVDAQPNITSVAYADNATLPLGPFATFRGQAVDATAVLIGYTRTGDANLDGLVNDDDATILGAMYAPGVPQASWALGDFDYNGFVDDDDVTLLSAFFGASTAEQATPAASVPEPGTLALLLALAATAWIAGKRYPWPSLPAVVAARTGR